MHTSSLLLCFALAIAACGTTAPESTTLHASDYDQSCATADDCVPKVEGNVCPCACPSVAIAKKDEARANADAQRAFAQCEHVECGACSQSRTRCVAGKCALEVCSTGVCPPEASDAGTD
jgi:hypothetical protein